jgi:hypothetical protein
MAGGLHLRAEDEEDLAVISSCLQDSLVPLSDMRYEQAARRFTLAVNRFRWEEGKSSPPGSAIAPFERIACGIVFDGVNKVSLKGIDQGKRDRPLELLAIVTGGPARRERGAAAGGASILLVFAGGGTIHLESDSILCRLDDFGEAWPTKWQPRHRP